MIYNVRRRHDKCADVKVIRMEKSLSQCKKLPIFVYESDHPCEASDLLFSILPECIVRVENPTYVDLPRVPGLAA